MKPPRLVRKEFRDWLAGKKPRQVVGLRMSACECPLATFLHVKGTQRPVVTILYGEAGGPYEAMPDWAEAFTRAVDGSGCPQTRITAATALRILDGVR